MIAGSNSLPDLAGRIDAEHAAVISAHQRGIEHGIRCGELLTEAKAKLQHGQWLPWLRSNCSIPERTAQLYMRLAERRADLEGKSARLADMTIEQAVKLLATPKAVPTDEVRERVRAACDRNLGDLTTKQLRSMMLFCAVLKSIESRAPGKDIELTDTDHQLLAMAKADGKTLDRLTRAFDEISQSRH
jgi:Protein of unknown function (DUF3102)